MIRKILLACFIFTSLAVQAQEEGEKKGGFDPSRLYFGGNFGATFGNFTFINVSPQVGYRVSPIFSAGTGVNFIYQSNKQDFGYYTQTSNYAYVGLNVFGRVNPFRFVVLNVQPELNYVWGNVKSEPGSFEAKQEGTFVPSLLLGGGVVIPAGQRSSLVAMLQYDVVQDKLSPYGNSAFFTFGFNF
jgi:hypothetical protein